MATYRNMTKSSICAGGKQVPQRGYVEIAKPSSSDSALIASGALMLKPKKITKPAENSATAKEVK